MSVLWTSIGANAAILHASSRAVSPFPQHTVLPPAVLPPQHTVLPAALMGQNHPYKRTISKQTSSTQKRLTPSKHMHPDLLLLSTIKLLPRSWQIHMLKVFYLKALTGQTWRSQRWSSNSVQTEPFISVYCVLHQLRFSVLLCNFHSIFNSNFKWIL